MVTDDDDPGRAIIKLKLTKTLVLGETHLKLTKTLYLGRTLKLTAGIPGVLGVHSYTENQNMDLKEQLKHGIRFLDIRLHLEDDELLCYHGPIDLDSNFADVLDTVSGFLETNPSETVIMNVQWENGESGDNTKTRVEIFQEYLANIDKRYWYHGNK